MRQLNVRVSDELAEQLAFVAEVDGVPVAALARDALSALVEQRLADSGWQRRRADYLARLKAL